MSEEKRILKVSPGVGAVVIENVQRIVDNPKSNITSVPDKILIEIRIHNCGGLDCPMEGMPEVALVHEDPGKEGYLLESDGSVTFIMREDIELPFIGLEVIIVENAGKDVLALTPVI